MIGAATWMQERKPASQSVSFIQQPKQDLIQGASNSALNIHDHWVTYTHDNLVRVHVTDMKIVGMDINTKDIMITTILNKS